MALKKLQCNCLLHKANNHIKPQSLHFLSGEYSIEAKNDTGVCKSDFLVKVLPALPGEEPKAKKTLPPLAKAPKIVKVIKPLTSVAPGAIGR